MLPILERGAAHVVSMTRHIKLGDPQDFISCSFQPYLLQYTPPYLQQLVVVVWIYSTVHSRSFPSRSFKIISFTSTSSFSPCGSVKYKAPSFVQLSIQELSVYRPLKSSFIGIILTIFITRKVEI
ncbi:hypothetical protein H5410_035781 [Solanum commersonii]|uniref:Uncharacterized protein n=1 Tax=Solanum commersonii TaxID=4109 RepID=A0A9J5Y2V4_SOLCO|nr:hypothetical protein H5410_035781 [Solanum commersonii]